MMKNGYYEVEQSLEILDQMEEIRQIAASTEISSVDAIEECICILMNVEDTCDAAFEVLLQLQFFKEDEEKSIIQYPVDYCVRHCCYLFAKAAGFSGRNEWLNMLNVSSRHYKRVLEGCYVV